MPENLKSVEAWKSAPGHVRMLAGGYVDALIADLAALAARVAKLEGAINEAK